MANSISWEKSGVYVGYSGVVGFQEFMRVVLAIHEHTDYFRYKYAIHDMSGVGELDFSAVDMIQLLAQELGARYTNKTIKASVVTRNPEMAALVRQFALLTKLDIGLFECLAQAREWSETPVPRV